MIDARFFGGTQQHSQNTTRRRTNQYRHKKQFYKSTEYVQVYSHRNESKQKGGYAVVRAWMWAFLSAHSLIFYDERASRRSRLSPYLEIANLSKTINNIHTRFDILQLLQRMAPPRPVPSAYSVSGSTSLRGFYATYGASILITEFDVFNGLQCKSQCLYQL